LSSIVEPSVNSSCIPDTGCTDHYIQSCTPVQNKRVAVTPINVVLPDGTIMTSSHVATLDITGLPKEATECHIFPTLLTGSLLSIGKLCDFGCEATFSASEVTIKLNNKIIMTGTRTGKTGLWEIPLQSTKIAANLRLLQQPKTFELAQQYNNTIAKRVAFYHAAMFSPVLSTWIAAINAGRLTTRPELTAKQVNKYPPHSNTTA
jgi:hypothetical protein